MTMKYLLALPLIVVFLYILTLPKYQIQSKIFVLVFVTLLLMFALLPDLSTVIANYVGVGRGSDFLFYISHLLIFFILFKFYLTILNLKARMNELVQKMALQEAIKTKNPSHSKPETREKPHN